MFILVFLAIVVGGSLALFAWRAGKVGLGGRFSVVSRESMLLANNILLVVAMASGAARHALPVVPRRAGPRQAVGGATVLRFGLLPIDGARRLPHGRGTAGAMEPRARPELWQRLRWALAIAIASALVLPMVLGHWTPLIAGACCSPCGSVASVVQTLRVRIASAPRGDLLGRLRANSSSYYGMLLAHLGVGVFIAGVTLVKGYEVERDLRMEPGQSVEVGGYDFRFVGVTPARGRTTAP
jgi:cytochrome c-type biogenesis protein CcmF